MNDDDKDYDKLKLQLETYKQLEQKLSKELEEQRNKHIFVDRLIFRQCILKSRLKFISSFLLYLNSNSAVDGIFYRNWMELLNYNIEEKDNMIGDCQYQMMKLFYSIDPVKEYKHIVERKFINLIHSFEISQAVSQSSNDTTILPTFSEYTMIGIETIVDTNTIIPSAKLFFIKSSNPKDRFCLYMKAWNDFTDIPNFSVDCAWIYKNEIKSCCDHLDIIKINQHILNRELHYTKDIELLQQCAFPSVAIPKVQKIKYLEQLYDSIVNALSLIDLNYKFVGKHPQLFIVEKDECPITSINGKYPAVILKCNHILSLMAYKGLLTKQNSSTESIRCPFCRSDCMINMFVSKSIIGPQKELKDFKQMTQPSYLNFNMKSIPYISSKIISEEALNAL
jgi:hypothetical protein